MSRIIYLSFILCGNCLLVYETYKASLNKTRSDKIVKMRSLLTKPPECIGYAEQARKYMTICWISFHPCRSIRKQIWPCHKNGQGQPSVIIWINLVVLEYAMLYTKFQGHQPLGSEERDFWRFLPYRYGSYLGHVTRNIWTNFQPNIPWRLPMKFGFKRPSVFWGKEVLKCI